MWSQQLAEAGWHAEVWCHLDTAAHSLPNQTSTKPVVPFDHLELNDKGIIFPAILEHRFANYISHSHSHKTSDVLLHEVRNIRFQHETLSCLNT